MGGNTSIGGKPNLAYATARLLFYVPKQSFLTHDQAWKRVRGEKGEKDITPLGGSGGMLPRKKNCNIPYFKASIWCI